MSAGAVLYVRSLAELTGFYREVCRLPLVETDEDFVVLENDQLQLVLVRIPADIAASMVVKDPPELREAVAIKLVFVVDSLASARERASAYGGRLHDPEQEWTWGRWRICDGIDPECNIFQLRQLVSPSKSTDC